MEHGETEWKCHIGFSDDNAFVVDDSEEEQGGASQSRLPSSSETFTEETEEDENENENEKEENVVSDSDDDNDDDDDESYEEESANVKGDSDEDVEEVEEEVEEQPQEQEENEDGEAAEHVEPEDELGMETKLGEAEGERTMVAETVMGSGGLSEDVDEVFGSSCATKADTEASQVPSVNFFTFPGVSRDEADACNADSSSSEEMGQSPSSPERVQASVYQKEGVLQPPPAATVTYGDTDKLWSSPYFLDYQTVFVATRDKRARCLSALEETAAARAVLAKFELSLPTTRFDKALSDLLSTVC
ncbi:hypothetical protein ERJ75_001611800 [Trypanosoma vivax]|uniref:Uncharacterized protein n=1 Tax=Trypanosoma vivax (strain Y486) TaxID=1055687 RepID=G0TSZ5_TRYVY|nr:hypothetical protein ERJ75_001611800 [Trypanosoma vivax]CCC47075.1 conserved hypothetical protein, fragment [Trypanosoma vivax Y486]